MAARYRFSRARQAERKARQVVEVLEEIEQRPGLAGLVRYESPFSTVDRIRQPKPQEKREDA